VSSFWIIRSGCLALEPDPPVVDLHAADAAAGGVAAHTHRVADHRFIMTLLFAGALVMAGLFTLLSGRIMHAGLFGS
jgi:uncharacterized membrane protein